MKIGLLSDSHDNLPKIEKAVKFFNKNKVGFVLHAGDFVAPFTIPKLNMLRCDWRGVFGNNDGEREGLARISEGKIQAGPLRLELAGKKVILVHDINTINPDKESVDIIVCGHTHKSEVKNLAAKLVINPGECGGWLTGKSTLGVVDLTTKSHKILNI